MNSYLRAHFVKPFILYLNEQSIDYTKSQFYMPIFESALTRDELFLPLERTIKWTKDIAEQQGIEDFHYKVAKQMGWKLLPRELIERVTSERILAKALERLYLYIVENQNDVTISISNVGSTKVCIEIIKQTCSDKNPIWSASDWLVIWGHLQIIKCYLGENWRPQNIDLSTYDHLPANIKSDFPDTQFTLGQGKIWFYFDEQELGVSNNYFVETKEFKVSKFNIESNLEEVLVPIIDQQNLDVHTAAMLLDRSTRKLQRELKTADLQFRNILRSLRMKSALKLLLDGSFSIKDVSEKVGYSKSTNFTRAFKTEYGVLPKDFLIANRI